MARREFNLKAYEKLFGEYYAAVLRYCFTLVPDTAEAEDLVQQAFVSLWQKMADGTIIHTSARAYLYKTAYNAGLNSPAVRNL